ncbi:alpha/beta fold hydrolase [Runella sp.]|jgi:pimeloyl-ACP methyl ester carboxylesterase|uniref:alpha/beta fold hydrolase n=1 Tax=Runella sp. TaxID=1960881 RepID=UPI00262E8F50|nr:alpha/beta fold hydrolase [Runella sp.]
MTQVLDTDSNPSSKPIRFLKPYRFVYGNGPKVMLGFHGIGQDHRCFLPLVEVLKEQYTFYLFDLPFHGQSPVLTTEKLTLAEWKAFLEDFLSINKIERFSIVGFSMGGKFALATLQLFPNRIESCWLLAPDGITESPWYRLATRFWLSKNLFRFFVSNVSRFKKLAELLVSMGLVEKSAVKFAETTLSTPEQRERVYRSWIGFSLIRADMKLVAQLVKKNKIDVKIFLGKHDALLPVHYVLPLTKQLPELKPIILKTGHHRLIEKVADWFRQV